MNQKQFIGKKIREFRTDIGLSASELGEKLDPPYKEGSITSWERGRTQPDSEILIQLCKIFGKEIDEFYYLDSAYKIATSSTPDNDDFIDVPLLGRIAAGEAIEMDEVENTFPIPKVVYTRYPKSFLLTVDGESMNKILPNGCYALINPTKEVTKDNAPYAVCINGYDATIKRVHRLNNGFELVPDSTDPTFEPKVFNYNEPDTMTITPIGEVVWYTLPYDWSF